MLILFRSVIHAIILTVLTLFLLVGSNWTASNWTANSIAHVESDASETAIATVSQQSVLQTDAIADVMIEPTYFGELGDPTDPYYQAVQSLVERYGIDVSLPDGTVRPDEPLTRGDFMVYLNEALNIMVDFMNTQINTR